MVKMITRLIAAAAVLLFLMQSSARAEMIFTANLTGSQEVPPVTTNGFGNATLVLNDDETELSYTVEVFGFDFFNVFTSDDGDNIVGLHIHAAQAGSNGGVVFGIYSPSQDDNLAINLTQQKITFSGVWDAGDASNQTLASQLMDLKTEGLYLNLHTTEFTGGEIRGQIVPEPSTAALALIGIGGFCVLRRRRR